MNVTWIPLSVLDLVFGMLFIVRVKPQIVEFVSNNDFFLEFCNVCKLHIVMQFRGLIHYSHNYFV